MATRAKQRSRTALRSGSVTPAELSHSMEQMQRLLWDFYRGLGGTPKQMQAAFRSAARNAGKHPFRMAEAAGFEIVKATADLMEAWYREAVYVDDVGEPLALRPMGEHSFETLSRRFLPDHSPLEVCKFFADLGLVVRLSNGTLKPRRRTAVISSLNAVTLDRVAVLMQGLLGTLQWNYGGRGTQQPRLERQVHATHVPLELLPEFNAKAKELGALLIGQLDNWLAARLRKDESDKPTARIGVSLLAYVEESESPRRSTRKVARRRSA